VRAAKRGLVCAVLALPAISLIWLVPFVLAGGAIALGLLGRRSDRGRLALAAIAIGGFVLAVCTVFSDWTSST
jgi:hypothetical protein